MRGIGSITRVTYILSFSYLERRSLIHINGNNDFTV